MYLLCWSFSMLDIFVKNILLDLIWLWESSKGRKVSIWCLLYQLLEHSIWLKSHSNKREMKTISPKLHTKLSQDVDALLQISWTKFLWFWLMRNFWMNITSIKRIISKIDFLLKIESEFLVMESFLLKASNGRNKEK